MTRNAVSLRGLARWAGLAALTTALLLTGGAPRPAHAAGMVVNTLADANPPSTDGLCSLREAITNANDNAATWPDCPAGAGADTITFSVSGTIVLLSRLPDITDSAGLVLNGKDRSVGMIGNPASGYTFNVGEGGSFRVDQMVIIDGLVYNLGYLTITESEFSSATWVGYSALSNSGTAAVRNTVFAGTSIANAGSFVLEDSLVTLANRGVMNAGTRGLTIRRSRIAHNQSSDLNGAGLHNWGVATVIDSTIEKNAGHGVFLDTHFPEEPKLTLVNTTVSGNTATAPGAGIRIGWGRVHLINSTVTNNQVTGVNGRAGGVYSVHAWPDDLTMSNSIIYGNDAATEPDCFAYANLVGPNLIGDTTGCTITGTPPIVADPLLAPLADNGGPTWTHALLPGSPALGAGDPAVCAAAPVSGLDQRGVARPQGAGCDLGSYEATPVGGKHLRVSAPSGQIKLGWDSGFSQTGYTLLTYNTATASATLTNLPANAVAHTDGTVANGTVYCYLLAATGPAGVLGLSDLACGLTDLEAGTVLPSAFTLSLHGTTNASLSWQAPTGGADSYLLVRIPLDGSAASNVPLAGSATSSVQPVPAAGACFQLVAFKGASNGLTNVVCGVPGISTLSGVSAEAALQAVAERVADSPSLRAMR